MWLGTNEQGDGTLPDKPMYIGQDLSSLMMANSHVIGLESTAEWYALLRILLLIRRTQCRKINRLSNVLLRTIRHQKFEQVLLFLAIATFIFVDDSDQTGFSWLIKITSWTCFAILNRPSLLLLLTILFLFISLLAARLWLVEFKVFCTRLALLVVGGRFYWLIDVRLFVVDLGSCA